MEFDWDFTEDERQEGVELVGRMFGLDEFEMVVIAQLARDLKAFEGTPEPGSEYEEKILQLGALVAPKVNKALFGEED